jgi:hypothetical protein
MVREMTLEEEDRFTYASNYTPVSSWSSTPVSSWKYEPPKEAGMRITVKNAVSNKS